MTSATNLSVVVAVTGRSPFNLVSGHLPDPSAPDQVLASFTLQQDYGVQLGTVIHMPLYASSQFSAVNNAKGAPPNPAGPTVALRVVGFEATEIEFPSGTTTPYFLYATPAIDQTVLPRTALTYLYAVRLRHGVADVPRFEDAASNLNLGSGSGMGASNEDAQAAFAATAHGRGEHLLTWENIAPLVLVANRS
jgi:hypothetical protein